MRIAFLIRAMDAGGAERAVSSLTGQMASRGHDVTLFVLLGRSSFYPLQEGVRVVYLQPEEAETAKKYGTVQRVRVLRRSLRKTPPDVLVGMSPFMSAYAAVCCAGLRTVSIGTERANPFVLYASRKMTLFRKAVSLLCNGFVCQTARALNFFPPSVRRRAAVIPNGIFNPLVFDTSVPKERTKEITALGRLDRNKGFDVLLAAFAAVHRAAPDYTLTIYVEGEERDALQSLSSKLGIAPFVSLPGSRQDAIAPISRSSVFVLSSRSEGMPNALIEAMAAGVPSVATRCDMGPDELIRNGENGLLVPVEDADAMSDAILRILHNRALSDSLSAEALRIRETHNIDAVVDRWIAYFEQRL